MIPLEKIQALVVRHDGLEKELSQMKLYPCYVAQPLKIKVFKQC